MCFARSVRHIFCDGDEPKSELARDSGDRLQSRNVPLGTSGDYVRISWSMISRVEMSKGCLEDSKVAMKFFPRMISFCGKVCSLGRTLLIYSGSSILPKCS